MRRQRDGQRVEIPVVDDADHVRRKNVNEETQAQSHEEDLHVRTFGKSQDGVNVLERPGGDGVTQENEAEEVD